MGSKKEEKINKIKLKKTAVTRKKLKARKVSTHV